MRIGLESARECEPSKTSRTLRIRGQEGSKPQSHAGVAASLQPNTHNAEVTGGPLAARPVD